MGTRNLTMVKHDGKTPIAQYGQWDGHPSGLGATVLEFATRVLSDPAERAVFEQRLAGLTWIDEKEYEAAIDEIAPGKGGWMTEDQAREMHARFPAANRDIGGRILQMVHDGTVTQLNDSLSFGENSLFCEYAYDLDLDTNRLDCYVGFNSHSVPRNGRWAGSKGRHGELKFPGKQDDPRLAGQTEEYYPVELVASFPLASLPDTETFIETVSAAEKRYTEAFEEAKA